MQSSTLLHNCSFMLDWSLKLPRDLVGVLVGSPMGHLQIPANGRPGGCKCLERGVCKSAAGVGGGGGDRTQKRVGGSVKDHGRERSWSECQRTWEWESGGRSGRAWEWEGGGGSVKEHRSGRGWGGMGILDSMDS